jgi:hypothetical protein
LTLAILLVEAIEQTSGRGCIQFTLYIYAVEPFKGAFLGNIHHLLRTLVPKRSLEIPSSRYIFNYVDISKLFIHEPPLPFTPSTLHNVQQHDNNPFPYHHRFTNTTHSLRIDYAPLHPLRLHPNPSNDSPTLGDPP